MVSEKGLFVNEPGNKEKKSLMQEKHCFIAEELRWIKVLQVIQRSGSH